MRSAIIDIDGTIADCAHRRHFVAGPGKKDWKAFFAGIPDDKPVDAVVSVVRALSRVPFAIILCSGRQEYLRPVTEAWLRKWFIVYDRLYMRPDKDNRDDMDVKRDLLAKIRGDGYVPQLVIDDRDRVVKMWRAEGLVCLQAAPGDY